MSCGPLLASRAEITGLWTGRTRRHLEHPVPSRDVVNPRSHARTIPETVAPQSSCARRRSYPAQDMLHLNASAHHHHHHRHPVHHRHPGRHRRGLRSLGRGCWTPKAASATAAGRRSNGSALSPSGAGCLVARSFALTLSSTAIASGRASQTPALERRQVATFPGSRDRLWWTCAPRSSGARRHGWLHSRSKSGWPVESQHPADHPRDRRCWRDLHGRPGSDRCRRC